MNLGISFFLIGAGFIFSSLSLDADSISLRERVLKERAIASGLLPIEELNPKTNSDLVTVGKTLFEAEYLSLNSSVSCRSCHLPQFSSADGLPNAIGVRGKGEGKERLESGGEIVPRNTLPLWGRGSDQFDVFFWDGKVKKIDNSELVVSQFGTSPPSLDPLVVAAHLPPVEFNEMVDDTYQEVLAYETESKESALAVYSVLVDRVKADKPTSLKLAYALQKEVSELTFSDVAIAIAEFIRFEFRLRQTPFHEFVFKGKSLSKKAIKGGLIFYGKGQCSVCHNGPLFSDLDFHAIPFKQLGFGKNGFGVDYGRYNVTFVPEDQYKFRTPPLYNVEHTAPYSHSGSVYDLGDAIRAHIDPLSAFDYMDDIDRSQFYSRLKAWSKEPIEPVTLREAETEQLIEFLKSLSFCKPNKDEFCNN